MKEKKCCKDLNKTESIDKLKVLLANILLVKHGAYGIHWHIKGQGFLELHNFSEEVYNFLIQRYDVIAERIIQLKGVVPLNLEKQLEAKTIEPIDHEYINVRDGWQLLKYYLRRIARETVCVKNRVDELGDTVTSALLDEDIIELDKFLWLAKASCPCNELPAELEAKISCVCKIEKK